MWFDIAVGLLSIFGVMVATYTDLKERIIPDNLTYPLIIAGVALHLGYGAYRFDPLFGVSGLLGAAGAFGLGYLMWYVGGWAGGDVKLFTALGALLAGYSSESILPALDASYVSAPYPFPLTVFLNSFLCLAPVLFAYVIYRAAKTPDVGSMIADPIRENYRRMLVSPFAITGGSVLATEVLSPVNAHTAIQVLLSLVFIFIIYRLPLKVELPVALGLAAYGLYPDPLGNADMLLISFAIVWGIALLITGVKVINREVLEEKVQITELKDGMIPAETIYLDDGEVGRYEGEGIMDRAKGVLKGERNVGLRPDWDEILADSRKAAGFYEEDIKLLKEFVKEGELEDRIRIKQGLPFAPSFGIGVPIALFYGDIYWLLIELLSG
ncbi:MAG: A24 family peptidase C-terminal domain-containing protein [Candidatus Hadarchaeia archaeon]